MKRHLLNLAAVLSLLLAGVTVVFWFRSTGHRDVVEIPFWPRSHDEFVIQSQDGELQFEIYPNNAGLSGFSIDHSKINPNRWLVWQTEFDFDGKGNDATETPPHLWVPHWFALLIFLILPTYWVVKRWLSRKRFAAGLCQTCGYDLRATPDRCPECGRVAAHLGNTILSHESHE